MVHAANGSKPIFVVQPGQDGRGDDSVAVTDVMPRWLRKLLGRHLGNPRTEAGVCATLVVVRVWHSFSCDASRPRRVARS